jgi:hypothetical protein
MHTIVSRILAALLMAGAAACGSAAKPEVAERAASGLSPADAVIAWNEITAQAIATAAAANSPLRPGPSSVLDYAMVHAAVHDAVQAIEGRFEPYAVVILGASGSSTAAAATAAHDVLVNRFPAQAAGFLDPKYLEYLAANGLSVNDPGVAVGQQAAAGLIALRANDGSFPNPPLFPFTGGTSPGEWRPTPSYLPGPPPSGAAMAAEWLAFMTPFTLTSPDHFRPQGPPALTSGKYTKEYDEVKRLGRDLGSDRTQAQTDLAIFWNVNFVLQWNVALRQIAAAHIDNIAGSARLFALSSLAVADAVITAWDSKRHFVFWRPVTAIQEGDADGNPKTEGDPSWRPFINTPPYPEYSSGANNLTGATTKTLQLYFHGNSFTFQVTSLNPLAVPSTRTYTHFSDAAADVVEARILQGIHFRAADVVGRKQGRSVAKWVFKHYLRPIHGDDEDEDDDDNEED